MKDIISNMYWIDKRKFTADIKNDLTIYPKQNSMNPSEVKPIETYVQVKDKVGLPITYGRDLFGDYVNQTQSQKTYDFNVTIKPRDELQGTFFNDSLRMLRQEHCILSVAQTGVGKSVMSMYCANLLHAKTIVLVDRKSLLRQWKETAMDFLHLKENQIGIIKEERCDIDRPFTIGMIQTVLKDKFAKRIFNEFSFMIVDEAHVVGANRFSLVIQRFNARYKMAITATPKRVDGCETILYNYFGRPSVIAESKAEPIVIHGMQFRSRHAKKLQNKWIAGNLNKTLKVLTDDDDRNNLILSIVQAQYKHKKNILLIGARVGHIKRLAMLIKDKLEIDDVGVFIGGMEDKEIEETMKKRIIIGTYGVMSKGVDIPKLDVGIDITPQSQAIQVIGRVRRIFPGKTCAYWYTIIDLDSPLCMGMFNKRRREYMGAENVDFRLYGKAYGVQR